MNENRILNHPDKEEIIQKLLAGVSPNTVNIWLQEKYIDDKNSCHGYESKSQDY